MKKIKKLNKRIKNNSENIIRNTKEDFNQEIIKNYTHFAYPQARSNLTTLFNFPTAYYKGKSFTLYDGRDCIVEFIPFINKFILFADFYGVTPDDILSFKIYYKLKQNKCNPILLYYKDSINYIIKDNKIELFENYLRNKFKVNGQNGNIYIGIPINDSNIDAVLRKEFLYNINDLFKNDDDFEIAAVWSDTMPIEDMIYYRNIILFNIDRLIKNNKEKEKFLKEKIFLNLIIENVI